MDGTCIYLTMAAIFLAQATNTELTLWQQLGIIGILLLTSKGAAGVTGSGFIVLAATLASVGNIPVASIALILGIDRFMSEARAFTNLSVTALRRSSSRSGRGRLMKTGASAPQPGDRSRSGRARIRKGGGHVVEAGGLQPLRA